MSNNKLKTNLTMKVPNRWHNSPEGFVSIWNLYHSSKNSETIIFDFNRTTYVSFVICVLFKLCFDKLKYMYNKELLVFRKEKLIDYCEIFTKLNLVPTDEIKLTIYLASYSFSAEQEFKENVNETLNIIKNEIFKQELKTMLFELFINATQHGIKNNSAFGPFGIYYGIIISSKKIRVCLANNGNFFSKSIKEKLDIEYDYEYEFIKKSLEYGFSTKEEYDGGLGLYLIKEFAKKYSAKFQIISGKGFLDYKFTSNVGKEATLLDCSYDSEYSLPGTCVYLEISQDSIISENTNAKNEGYLDLLL